MLAIIGTMASASASPGAVALIQEAFTYVLKEADKPFVMCQLPGRGTYMGYYILKVPDSDLPSSDSIAVVEGRVPILSRPGVTWVSTSEKEDAVLIGLNQDCEVTHESPPPDYAQDPESSRKMAWLGGRLSDALLVAGKHQR